MRGWQGADVRGEEVTRFELDVLDRLDRIEATMQQLLQALLKTIPRSPSPPWTVSLQAGRGEEGQPL